MSDSTLPVWKRPRFRVIIMIIVVVVFLLAIIELMMLPVLQLVFYLLAGWIFFLWDVGNRMQVDWGSIAFGLGALLVFFFMLHGFCCWFVAAARSRRAAGEPAESTDGAPPVDDVGDADAGGAAKTVESGDRTESGGAVDTAPSFRWSWRWSLAVTMIVVLMFGAGIAMVGQK